MSCELKTSVFSPLFVLIYRALGCAQRWRLAGIVMHWLIRVEGGMYESATARKILQKYHGVEIGAYSYGECFSPGKFPQNVRVGRYVSIAGDVRVFTKNHPIDRLSTHPFFYDKRLGIVSDEKLNRGQLLIEHDAWLGIRSIITPGCNRIGIGAVVAAGAVVTKDVEDFAVVAGIPAKVIKFRFDQKTRKTILESQWWERSLDDLKEDMDHLTLPLTAVNSEYGVFPPANWGRILPDA